MARTIKTIFWTLLVAGLLAGSAGALFVYSGVYQIAANKPHLGVVRWLLTTAQQRAVTEHAEGLRAPPLRNAALIQRGFVLYQDNCLVCHGAPGYPRAQIGRGLNPNPPPLYMAASEWTDAELYWIIRHGLKMAGMPAFDAGHSDFDLWAMTAFTRRLPELSVAEYALMVRAARGELDPARVPWVDDDDAGWAALRAAGNPDRGEELIEVYGCGSCHVIPGVSWARGKAGPPLIEWAERHFIAGTLLNSPNNLIRWIMNPQAIEPGTAMPDLGVKPDEARDMAAYLFTIGDPQPRR